MLDWWAWFPASQPRCGAFRWVRRWENSAAGCLIRPSSEPPEKVIETRKPPAMNRLSGALNPHSPAFTSNSSAIKPSCWPANPSCWLWIPGLLLPKLWGHMERSGNALAAPRDIQQDVSALLLAGTTAYVRAIWQLAQNSHGRVTNKWLICLWVSPEYPWLFTFDKWPNYSKCWGVHLPIFWMVGYNPFPYESRLPEPVLQSPPVGSPCDGAKILTWAPHTVLVLWGTRKQGPCLWPEAWPCSPCCGHFWDMSKERTK